MTSKKRKKEKKKNCIPIGHDDSIKKKHETNNRKSWLKQNPYIIFYQVWDFDRKRRKRYPSCCWEAAKKVGGDEGRGEERERFSD